jgi:uncharacterized membrane protein YgcG
MVRSAVSGVLARGVPPVGWCTRVLGAVASVALVLLGPALSAPAAAQPPVGERIEGYRVLVEVRADGTVVLAETIDYDFGRSQRHGIYRDVVVRQAFDADHDRVYPFRLRSVSSPTAPDEVSVLEEGPLRRIRIGDPDRTVSGRHTYTVVYELDGVLNGFGDHDELYWNVVGPSWPVHIDRVAIEVRTPAAVTEVGCFAGAPGVASPCDRAAADGAAARFEQGALGPGQVVTVVVALPKGAVPEPAPVLEELWRLDKAFAVTPFTVGAAAVLGVAVLGGVGTLLWRVGRDRRAVGSVIDVGFASGAESTQRVGFREDRHWPVEYAPPDGIRPGLIGTLVDERVDRVDVTATLVDLAVRGHLRIERVDRRLRADDHRLVRVPDPPGDDLAAYEALLLAKIFAGRGPEVLLSDLRNEFAASYAVVVDAMYDEVVAQGFFDRCPRTVRRLWAVLGVLALAAGAGLLVAAAAYTRLALPAVPFVLGGLVLLVGSRYTPARTARGHGLLRRCRGFETFIEESEKERARFAVRQELFSEYLPYALVFGSVSAWSRAFADADGNLPPAAVGWYVGGGTLDVRGFERSMDGLVAGAAAALTSTPGGSGGSGFSGGSAGGGGGGGGGGSW